MAGSVSQIANRYEIISLIGQGGMADVYKARDSILNRIVAIKVLREKLSEDPMTLVRFQREASAASRLSHPNVVDIYDVGEYNGMHYIVMEYIRGRTLKQLISLRGALSVEEACHIMKQLTSAVLNAHQNNIIHRDIKPQNVLVKDDGTIKITDFGIAVATGSVGLTLNNAVMGSAHYLAPETAQGKEPNFQVDIYSLGIVFFELLTGSVPYHGKTPTEIAIKHLREPIPYVRDFNPSIPQSVENIILKATAKNVDDRYEDVSMMLYDIVHYNDVEYRNMSRLKFKTQNISNVAIDDGKVTVEYDDEYIDDEPKKKKNYMPYILTSLGVVIALVVVVLVGSLTGIMRFSGFLGYQTMPQVENLTEEEAIDALKKANFNLDKVEFVEDVSDQVEAGVVIKSSYKKGEVIPGDSNIIITVCKGPSFLVEDYTGRSLVEVTEELLARGVNLDIQTEYKGVPDTNPGIILEQKDLSAGDRIDPEKGEKITFVVSQYPTITIGADLIGKDVDEAQRLLNEQGIAVLQVEQGTSGQRKVVSISPDVGSQYTQEGTDSVVTLYYD